MTWLSLSLHAATVDCESTLVKHKETADLPCVVQTYESMGDSRHKKSPPPSDLEEDVTPAFRKQVRELLDNNEQSNKLRGLRKGDPGYRISNQSELADAIPGCDKSQLRRMLGGVRAGTKVTNPIHRSTYVAAIRAVLGMPPVRSVLVREDRARIVQLFAELPDEAFKIFESALKARGT
jgi:hypothetical protein